MKLQDKFNEKELLEHLAGMVRFATVSDAETDRMDFAQFTALHRYLEETYPLVHSTLEKTVIGRAALLYRWPGSDPDSRLPILLAAHQDVVPEGAPEEWEYPPYEGVIKDGVLRGRGSSDCKSQIMEQMEAIEELIREGFTPSCDVYLGYGYNEEVGSADNSAAMICDYLKEKGIRLGCVIDEGGSIGPVPDEGISQEIACINIAEKGYVDVGFIIRDEGGHSMKPGKRSIIAELGKVAQLLHENPYAYRLTPALQEEYEIKAKYIGDPAAAAAFADIGSNFDACIPFIDTDPSLAAKFHTTMALTMLEASERSNILPSKVQLTMNCRLQEGDTIDSLLERCREIVGGMAEVVLIKGREHSEISRTDSEAYRCLKAAIKEIAPEAVAVPAISGGGTDARNYYPICDSVYRFCGYPSKISGNIHASNEYFSQDGAAYGPAFCYAMIRKYCG